MSIILYPVIESSEELSGLFMEIFAFSMEGITALNPELGIFSLTSTVTEFERKEFPGIEGSGKTDGPWGKTEGSAAMTFAFTSGKGSEKFPEKFSVKSLPVCGKGGVSRERRRSIALSLFSKLLTLWSKTSILPSRSSLISGSVWRNLFKNITP